VFVSDPGQDKINLDDQATLSANSRLCDGCYSTRNEAHLWCMDFQMPTLVFLCFDLQKTATIAMLRIWVNL